DVFGDSPLGVRRKRDLRLLHDEDDRLVFLQVRDDRQQRENEQVDGTCALVGERHGMVAWLRRYEEPNDFAQMLAGQIRREERRRVFAGSEIDELAEPRSDVFPYDLELLDLPDGRVKVLQRPECFSPHFGCTFAAEPKDGVE